MQRQQVSRLRVRLVFGARALHQDERASIEEQDDWVVAIGKRPDKMIAGVKNVSWVMDPLLLVHANAPSESAPARNLFPTLAPAGVSLLLLCRSCSFCFFLFLFLSLRSIAVNQSRSAGTDKISMHGQTDVRARPLKTALGSGERVVTSLAAGV